MKIVPYLLMTALVFTIMGGTASAIERVHYIAAEEIEWDYAPIGRNRMMDAPFNENRMFLSHAMAGISAVATKKRFIGPTRTRVLRHACTAGRNGRISAF